MPFNGIGTALLAQRGALLPWGPVCLGIGIGIYFQLPTEPTSTVQILLLATAICATFAAMRTSPAISPLFWAMALIAFGSLWAGVRSHWVAAPVLQYRYYGPVEGRVTAIDRSSSDALRLTLDRVVLSRHSPGKTPARIRVALHGEQNGYRPAPGDTVILTAHLLPPSGPAEPGGFDFQRHAWFQRIGAVGYTRTAVLLLQPRRAGLPIVAARIAFSVRVQAVLPDESGAFAAAVMTGDRSAMGQSTLQALRRSNLAHLLAISGLHMGLVAGFVFALIRMILALIPGAGLRIAVKKIAALAALTVAAGYLILSGGNVATERAFVMVAVFLLAIVFDHRALSLRAVAVAAVVVLLLRPESLLSPGFQMSFAATTALVSVFSFLRDSGWLAGRTLFQRVFAMFLSSAVAGAATAPFAAAHFNQIAVLGLPANLLSVPLMGILVIPAAVLATLLMPFGAEVPVMWLMGLGLRWILTVARFVSEQDGAVRMVQSPDWRVLPVFALAALVVMLWRGRGRWVGTMTMIIALILWRQSERPDLLIAEDGALVGMMTTKGRAMSKENGSGFVAAIWLENDGDPAPQIKAAHRWPEQKSVVQVVSGKKAAAGATCNKGEWLIGNNDIAQNLPCRVFDPTRLRATGSVAVYFSDTGPRIVTARQLAGDRPWTSFQSQ
ncbi:ComEC family competence protein [Thalassovita gelatinovora]|uniref:ComEC family competence protein n=1 Tax=Thalassovita gelatinovora TaxID=53501 RepID=A0A0P1F4F4_THAGE|nr:ComEC/Rec2 family competence protein [Thalassovita gelatinovora]CUH62636.1 ComEC family competence protein [Thalassovita gelatinovora]SEQ07660.1 competence protein ComEC [Thalassovita gelatinovora]